MDGEVVIENENKCPVCGSPVIHHCGDEGTQYYEPLYARLETRLKTIEAEFANLFKVWDSLGAYKDDDFGDMQDAMDHAAKLIGIG